MNVRVPIILRKYTNGVDVVSVSGSTVGEILDNLCKQYPEFKTRLFKDDGSINRFVNIFLDNEDIRFLDNLKTPVSENNELSIIQAVAGG